MDEIMFKVYLVMVIKKIYYRRDGYEDYISGTLR